MSVTKPAGYKAEDFEQYGLEPGSTSSEDLRDQFKHDHDRVLYSSAFAALAGKSQVVSAGEGNRFHTRLTHSLKVSQVGRRLAERFAHELGGPDPDLVSTACLAHDLGHPPFGHAGEQALDREMGTVKAAGDSAIDGFEGNAQNLRILTHLEVHNRASRGLHLSRAALDATTKYPWARSVATRPFSDAEPRGQSIKRQKKFGIYIADVEAGEWVLAGREVADRPIEEQIMDWADDVTYACHDLMDFYRVGAIPLDRLLAFGESPTAETAPDELVRFISLVQEKWTTDGKPFSADEALEAFVSLQEILRFSEPFKDTFDNKVDLTSGNSRLITKLLSGVELQAKEENLPRTRYNATLNVPDHLRFLCDLLKELIWTYVINNPRLATQQHGQTTIVTDLLNWYHEDAERLLPIERREDLQNNHPKIRVVVDHVASLTEPQAIALHRRMSGSDLGAFSDDL